MVTAPVALSATQSAVPTDPGRLGCRFLGRRSLEKGLVLSALVHLSLVGAYRAAVDRAAPPDARQTLARPILVRPIPVTVIVASNLAFLVPGERIDPGARNGVLVPVPREGPVSLFPQGVTGPVPDDPSKSPGDPGPPNPRTDSAPEAAARFATVEMQPVPIEAPRPAYPEWAREAGIQGTVILHVLVGTDGGVKRIVVVRGVTGLDDEASRAVRGWRFRPAMSSGVPLAVWVEIPVAFHL